MNLFGFTKKVNDERITQIQNKIYREMYVLVSVICGLSIAVKSFLLGFEIEMMVIELVILFAQGAYYIFRSSSLGIFSAEAELHDRNQKTSLSKKNIIGGLVAGFAIALFFGIRSAILFADTVGTSITYFIMVFLVSLVIYIPFFVIFLGGSYAIANKRSQKAIENELGNDEENGDWNEKH
ncbi:hypothetical protein LG329_09220 [Virgibacillus necropolis]|uniref:DUF6773 family protein n=1 Tax=Virgibacillus necropolis TaxID=163877 RepID=UPI00384D37C5